MRQLDIRTIYRLLLSGWRLLLICTLIGGLLLGGFAYFFMPEKYTTGVSMYVSSLTDAAESQSGSASYSNLVSAEWLVLTYVDLLENPNTLGMVVPKLSRGMTAQQLSEMISLSSISDTAIMRITVTADDSLFAAEVCNAMAEVAPEVLENLQIPGSVKVIGEALPGRKTSPNVPRMAAFGLITGLIAAALFVVIRHLTDNTVKTSAELKERLQVPILGIVPGFDQKGKSYGRGGDEHA